VAGAEADLAEARAAIRARDLEALGLVAEHSALKMHAIGFAARPPLVYWMGATLECLRRVWDLRASGTPAFVTIDAGPQVKALCAPGDAARVADALRDVPGVERVLTCAPGGGAEVVA
jgi:diphosphomevalonate decarboxylase